MSSIVIGYVYCQLYSLLPQTSNIYINNTIAIALSVVLGYVCSKLISSKYVRKLFQFLRINNSTNTYLWDDLLDRKYATRVKIEYDDRTYSGYLHSFESESNSPHVAICLYKMQNIKTGKTDDHTKDLNHVIVLDTSSAKSVTFHYYESSPWCDKIKELAK